MHTETKKILVSFLVGLVLFMFVPIFQVSAAGLNVCGTTDPNKIQAYQTWLLENPKPSADNAAALETYYTNLSAKEKELGICQTKDAFAGAARIINTLIGYIGIFVIARIVMVGFMMVVSNGNQDAIKSHKKQLTYAFIGLIIVMGSYLIVNLFLGAFGFEDTFSFALNPFSE